MNLNDISDFDPQEADVKCTCSNCFIGLNRNGDLTGHICKVEGCTQLFTTPQNLQDHDVKYHRGKPFACPRADCDRTFAFSDVLKLHLRNHSGDEYYKCIDCNMEFYEKVNFEEHLLSHRQKQFSCTWPNCDHIFAFNDVLQLHLRMHASTRIVKSTESDSEISSKEIAKRSTANQQKSFSCTWPNCGQHFPFSTLLETHLRMHIGNKRFNCSLCSMKFYSEDHLTKHIKNHSNIAAAETEEIHLSIDQNDECRPDGFTRTFDRGGGIRAVKKLQTVNRSDIIKHTFEDPSAPRKQFNKFVCVCSNCVNDKHVPNAPKQHVCGVATCRKLFSAPSRLLKHFQVHLRGQPFACDFHKCKRIFASAKTLKSHYPCCRRNNPQTNTTKPKEMFKCNQENCTKSCSNYSTLILHYKMAHGTTCIDCFKSFKDTETLKIHRLEFHETESQNKIKRRNSLELRNSRYICPCSNCKQEPNGTKLHVCDFNRCGKLFKSLSGFILHQRTHIGERPFVCDFGSCSASFPRLAVLRKHRVKHIDDKRNTNSKQSKNQETSDFQSGIHDIHNDRRIYVCKRENCMKSFEKAMSLIHHRKKCHGSFCFCSNCANGMHEQNGQEQHICNYIGCGRLFSTSILLLNHETVHSAEFKCKRSKCVRSFRTVKALKLHLHFHKNIIVKKINKKLISSKHVTKRKNLQSQTFKCNWENCMMIFTREASLRDHIKKTHGTTCLDCRITFNDIKSMTRHRLDNHGNRKIESDNPIEVNHNRRTYICSCSYCEIGNRKLHICDFEGCGRLFKLPSKLLNHKRFHTDERLFFM